jgi:hypothetical protein
MKSDADQNTVNAVVEQAHSYEGHEENHSVSRRVGVWHG